jgi:hypothetical protein
MVKKPNFEKTFIINIVLIILNLFLAFIFISINLNGFAILFILCCCAHIVGAAMNIHVKNLAARTEKYKKILENNNKELK